MSLVRAEILLLVRNCTTLFNAVALAPATVAFIAWMGGDSLAADGASAAAGMLLTVLVAIALIFVVYYNLTTTLVARREELVLKRLLTGEVSRTEIVAACATPALLIVLAQVVLGFAATGVWFDLPHVQNVLWLLAALAGGSVVFVLLAVASSGVTRTVESAQLTTLPAIMIAMALSGFAIPVHVMPEVVATIASWTPMYPVVALLRHGFGTVGVDGTVFSGTLADVAQPLACLLLWAVLGAYGARRWMRWDPRR
ncbi:ABC transporter permease [Georgenia yuyongxinii]|uniref:ABC transporter permease n=1 Tax=Georgenia yuyongxinii TaxID=2589797 RepID=A0A5B8C856_9MICO|nr:ABC transporter permease [Georgenia yuyongxinii]QDC25302.1 ABC transporter permease [Georgenia yuyongxinii]